MEPNAISVPGMTVARDRGVDRNDKRAWLGRRAWVLAEGGARLGGTICSVDYRILPLAKIMIRLDGRRGTVLVQEMARGVSWDFADQAPGGSPGA